MDSDHEDYVFCGTPIESEEQVTTRKKKAVAEASGHLRSLPAWKQEVTDEEGRRRFHGAFTGGFAAGYYNTVGSKEGWTPQTFTSSRKNRAEVKQQSILNFLDEDEKSELEGQSLKTSMQFDTFGFTSAEIARKQAEKEQHERPSAIPGPVPDELILPTTESIGVKLLLKMGWRNGHSIKDSRANSLYDARREARKAFLAFSTDDANVASDAEPVKGDLESLVEQPTNDDVHSSQSTPVYVLHPKNDLHGLGFDPFKHAPEFREKKRSRVSGNKESGYRKSVTMRESLFGFKPGKVAPGFGIGALEELDAEDEDVYSTSFEFEDTHVEEEEKEPSELIIDNKKRLNGKERGVLLGFRIASKSDYQLERFDPPVIPKDFIPQHKFPGPLETDNKVADPPPREVPPPEDSNLKLLIEGVATLVAKCGKLFEDLSREKNQSNPLFSFLAGGNGSDYYARKLWEEQQKHNNDKTKLQFVGKLSPSVQQMTAESRGRILGEKPLERDSKDSNLPVASDLVHLQVNLKDTFTKPASFDELPKVAKPFTADPAKQERFERFLKEKYEGGLRSTYSGGTSNMSESARARERLDFEAAAEAIEKGKWTRDNKLSAPQFMEFAAAGGTKFTSGGLEQVKDVQAEDLIMKKLYPKREEFQWRPAPVLCKRFDLTDPYMGKPPPPPRIKSKMDSLIFMPDYVKATKVEETETMNRNTISAPQSDPLETTEDNEKEVEVESVERPVDLYKAIFSDDSDDEGDIPILNKVENPEKKAEAANTTLNRLIAGDFLESLGKELGLEVPPEMPCPMNKAKTGACTENANVNVGNAESETTHSAGVPRHQEIAHSTSKEELVRGFSENASGKANKEKVVAQEHTKADNLSGTSSSEDERSRKHSRRGRYKSSDSSSEDRHRSRDRKKESHREKSRSSSRKHSHRHKRHKRTDSPGRSHRDKDKDRREAKREKRKWRD